MSTNYFAVTPPCGSPCEHCAKPIEVHICKSMTSFRGWVRDWEDLPFGEIRSWAGWKKVLRSEAVVGVVDEYGCGHHIGEFIASVEATDLPMRRRQYQWMVDHYSPGDRKNYWLDPDGFTFCGTEFS